MLNGLILAGGESRRMGQDKAALKRAGVSLLKRSADLISAHCQQVFVSVQQQVRSGERANYPQIEDQYGGLGPVDGIASAQKMDAESAWLVLACDLPQLDVETVNYLLNNRSQVHEVTAFVSTNDGLPEPLCAIYEPSSVASVAAMLLDGRRCARKVVLNLNHHLIHQPSPGALDNANTPQEWARINAV